MAPSSFTDQFELAVLSIQGGAFEPALGHLHRARVITTDPIEAARCDDLIGAVLRRLGRSSEALDHLDAAISAFVAVGDERLAAASIETRAGVLVDLGRADEAVIDLDAALAAHERNGYELSARSTAQRLAGLLTELGRDAEARMVAQRGGAGY